MRPDLIEILHDVSEMEAPEPLVSTLDQLEELGEGQMLHMIHRMEPCVLFENLGKRGFAWEMEKNDQVHIYIWKKEE